MYKITCLCVTYTTPARIRFAMTRRVTVSLDDDSWAALETLSAETEQGQSEVVRRALSFYLN